MLNDGKDVPTKLVRQWKTLFLNGHSLQPKYELDLEKDAAKSLTESLEQTTPATAAVELNRFGTGPDNVYQQEILHGVEILDSTEFDEYLNATGDWAGPGES